MPDFKKLCPGCMREIKENKNAGSGGNGRNIEMSAKSGHGPEGFCCPYCGFSEAEYRQNPRCLPLNTILAGKYLVGKVLGEGGFGITYMGYDLNMRTRIAIKEYFPVELVSRDTTRLTSPDGKPLSGGGSDRVISLSGEKSKTYRQGLKKYVDEACSVSQFSGIPGIVSVKDFFYENDTAYIVMEYIEGMSLKEYLKQKGGKLSEEEALSILRPVLEALEKVHAAGIVHRDISPDNIMLTFTEDAGAETERATTNGRADVPCPSAITPSLHGNIAAVRLIDFGAARMTAKCDQKSLTIILKHGYAPEEQYRSHGEQGPWTDVYALCAVLYRMLTGIVPEPAMDRLFSDHLKRPEELGAAVSPSVSEALMRGLAVKKEGRISSVKELSDVLYAGKKLKRKPVQEHSRRGKGLAAALAACVVLLAAAAGVGFLKWGTAPAGGNGENGLNQEETGTMLLAGGAAEEDGGRMDNGLGETTAVGPEEGQLSEESLTLEDTAYQPGEQIVWPKAETMIAGGYKHLVALRDDGTVLAAGVNGGGQCNVQEWESIAAVYANWDITAGLRTDGTVVVAGNDAINEAVSSWRGVTMLAVGMNHILGLTQDGSVLSAGENLDGCCETGDWENVSSVMAARGLSIGITEDGSLLLAGSLGSVMTQEEEQAALEEIASWTQMRQIATYNAFIYGLTQDGSVLCAGRANRRSEQLEAWKGVVSLAVGDGFVAGLLEDGTVLTADGAVNDQQEETAGWSDVAALARTEYNLACLRRDGTILVTEPSRSGNSTLSEILSMTDAAQAVWRGDSLFVLQKNGGIRHTGYVEYFREEISDIDGWQDIVSLAANDGILVGLRSDGSVIRTENDGVSVSGELIEELGREEATELAWARKEQTPDLLSSWTDVKEMSLTYHHAAALLQDGTAVAAGFPEFQADIDYRTGLTPDGACQVEGWSGLKQVLALEGETIGLKEDGTLLTTKEMPEEWKAYTDTVSIWGYGWTAAAIRSDGTVVYLRKGDDDYGQNNVSGWTDMVQLSIGSNHTVGLRADGTVVAVGDNYAGQCEVADWSGIVSVAAGESGTVGITQDGSVLLAGTLPGDYFVAEDWPAITLP